MRCGCVWFVAICCLAVAAEAWGGAQPVHSTVVSPGWGSHLRCAQGGSPVGRILSLRGGGKPSKGSGIYEEKDGLLGGGPKFRAGLQDPGDDPHEGEGDEGEESYDDSINGSVEGGQYEDNEEIDSEDERMIQEKHKMLRRAVEARPYDTEALDDLAEFAWDTLGDIGSSSPPSTLLIVRGELRCAC